MKKQLARVLVIMTLIGFSGMALCQPNANPIQGQSTQVTMFLDSYAKGPMNTPTLVTTYNKFIELFGHNSSVQQYFIHGGSVAYIVNTSNLLTGLDSEMPKDLSLIVMPSLSTVSETVARPVREKALKLANDKNYFLILDAPARMTVDQVIAWQKDASDLADQDRAALYYPQIEVLDPNTNKNVVIGAASAVAGIYADTDMKNGVWKSPAGVNARLTVSRILLDVTDAQTGTLNSPANGVVVNSLRTFPNYGPVVWGAKTTAGLKDDLSYVSVRRTLNYIQKSFEWGLKWTVFEDDDQETMSAVVNMTSGFLVELWKQGGLFGSTAAQAFKVTCDSSNNSQADSLKGILNIDVALAMVRPAEFQVFRMQAKTQEGQ